MDPFCVCLAMGPVAVYLLALGMVNLFRRPFLVSGVRDAAALALAVSGMALVGPVELFFPVSASISFGGYVWLFLISLYAFFVISVLLALRPRLVIYNISADELRPVLANVVAELDCQVRWAGDALSLPQLGVQLYVEKTSLTRNVSLVSAGPNQNNQGWRRLEQALRAALAPLEVPRNPRGVSILSAGVLLTLALAITIGRDPRAVAQGLIDMLTM